MCVLCDVEGTVMGEDELVSGRPWLCSAAASLCIISCITSLFTIALIALNRYVYVCLHNSYAAVFTRRRTVIAVISTWLVGVTFDLPNHLGWSSHRFDAKVQKCLWDRTTAYHYTILFVVGGMLLPFIVTTVCYWRIFAHIRVVKQRILRTQFQARPDSLPTRLVRPTLHVSFKTRNILDCELSNYSSRIILSHIPATLLS